MPRADSVIDWSASYTVAAWRVAKVDPKTWASSVDEIGGVTGARVSRDATTRLIESGAIDVDGTGADGECWGRIEALVEQAGVIERHAVATLLFSPAPSTVHRGWGEMSMEGRSVLAPAEDEKMLAGSYVPRGANGADWAARLLQECTPAPVTVSGSFALADHIVYTRKTSRLEAARMLLDAGGWCIQLTGSGEIVLCPRPETPSLVIDRRSAGLIGTEVEVDDGLSGVPNRYTACRAGQEGQATDEDPARRTSHARLGRWVDVVDESPKPAAGETLQQYAERKLGDAVSVSGRRSYGRSWVPGITTHDVIRGSLADARLVGDMRVVTQDLTLGRGIDVQETVEVIE